VDVKGRHAVIGNPALTHGVVMALLQALPGSITQRRYDALQAQLLLLKPGADA
jgi:hypothetical protein